MTGKIASLFPAQRFGFITTCEPVTMGKTTGKTMGKTTGKNNLRAGALIHFYARQLRNDYISNVKAGEDVTFTVVRTKNGYEAEEVEVVC